MKNLILYLMVFCVSSVFASTKVVFVAFDGWAAHDFDKCDMPNVKAMYKNGSRTLEKRSVLPSSSAVNWASMFMGAGPELHGYTEWGSKKPELPSRVVSKYGNFPSIFGVLRDARPDIKIAYFYEWETMGCLAETKAATISENVPFNNESRDITKKVCDYIKNEKPDLIVAIFDNPDVVGHKTGWYSPEYFAMVKKLDDRFGEIVQAVKDSGEFDNTVFVITSDHGGYADNNKGKHGGKTMLEMQTPLIICGKGIKKNFDITDSVMQFDVAPTLARILGVKTFPQVWIGRPIGQSFAK